MRLPNNSCNVPRCTLMVLPYGSSNSERTHLSLMGGLASSIQPLLSGHVKNTLVQPKGDALDGALQLARLEAEKVEATTVTI